jgi:hypothetical protein
VCYTSHSERQTSLYRTSPPLDNPGLIDPNDMPLLRTTLPSRSDNTESRLVNERRFAAITEAYEKAWIERHAAARLKFAGEDATHEDEVGCYEDAVYTLSIRKALTSAFDTYVSTAADYSLPDLLFALFETILAVAEATAESDDPAHLPEPTDPTTS